MIFIGNIGILTVSMSCDQQQSKMADRKDITKLLMLFSAFVCVLCTVHASDVSNLKHIARNRRSVLEFEANGLSNSISSLVSQMLNKEENSRKITKRDVSCPDNSYVTDESSNAKVSRTLIYCF